MAEKREDVKAEYVPSTQQLDLEARLAAERAERGEEVPGVVARDFTGGRSEEELDGFVGVDPIYRNYAEDTEKPLFAEEGSAEGEFEQRHVDNSDRIIVGFSEEEQARRDANERRQNGEQDDDDRRDERNNEEKRDERDERGDRSDSVVNPGASEGSKVQQSQPVKPATTGKNQQGTRTTDKG